jgi:hypothetical protein
VTVLRFFFKVALDQGWTVLSRAEIDLVPNRDNSADTHPDFRTQGVEIRAGWIRARGQQRQGLCEPVAGGPRVRAAQTQRRFQHQVTARGSRPHHRRCRIAASSNRRLARGVPVISTPRRSKAWRLRGVVSILQA